MTVRPFVISDLDRGVAVGEKDQKAKKTRTEVVKDRSRTRSGGLTRRVRRLGWITSRRQ